MRKIILAVVLIVSLIIINNLVHSIFNLWQKQELVGKTEQELQREKEQYAKLQKQYTVVKKDDFIEKEARNKLFFTMPGEQVVILPNSNTPRKKQVVAKRKREIVPLAQWFTLFSLPVPE